MAIWSGIQSAVMENPSYMRICCCHFDEEAEEKRLRARLVAGLCLGVFFAGPLTRLYATPMGQIYGYFSCFDQIALGCLTAICFPLTRQWFKSSPYAIFVPIVGASIGGCLPLGRLAREDRLGSLFHRDRNGTAADWERV